MLCAGLSGDEKVRLAVVANQPGRRVSVSRWINGLLNTQLFGNNTALDFPSTSTHHAVFGFAEIAFHIVFG